MLYKYELPEEAVKYILEALNRTQTVGMAGAQSLLKVIALMNSPVNLVEIQAERGAKTAPEVKAEEGKEPSEDSKEIPTEV